MRRSIDRCAPRHTPPFACITLYFGTYRVYTGFDRQLRSGVPASRTRDHTARQAAASRARLPACPSEGLDGCLGSMESIDKRRAVGCVSAVGLGQSARVRRAAFSFTIIVQCSCCFRRVHAQARRQATPLRRPARVLPRRSVASSRRALGLGWAGGATFGRLAPASRTPLLRARAPPMHHHHINNLLRTRTHRPLHSTTHPASVHPSAPRRIVSSRPLPPRLITSRPELSPLHPSRTDTTRSTLWRACTSFFATFPLLLDAGKVSRFDPKRDGTTPPQTTPLTPPPNVLPPPQATRPARPPCRTRTRSVSALLA